MEIQVNSLKSFWGDQKYVWQSENFFRTISYVGLYCKTIWRHLQIANLDKTWIGSTAFPLSLWGENFLKAFALSSYYY